jgi:hypothetical protein
MSTTATRLRTQTTAPPGPDANILAQAVAFHRDPLRFLRRAQETYGDVFQLRLLTARPTFVVADPEAVEALLVADPERAHAGEARRAVLPFASARSRSRRRRHPPLSRCGRPTASCRRERR